MRYLCYDTIPILDFAFLLSPRHSDTKDFFNIITVTMRQRTLNNRQKSATNKQTNVKTTSTTFHITELASSQDVLVSTEAERFPTQPILPLIAFGSTSVFDGII